MTNSENLNQPTEGRYRRHLSSANENTSKSATTVSSVNTNDGADTSDDLSVERDVDVDSFDDMTGYLNDQPAHHKGKLLSSTHRFKCSRAFTKVAHLTIIYFN